MCYIVSVTRIGVRELRQHASRYLDKVKAGEVVEVTERGKLIALLVAPTPAVAVRDQLVASGRIVPARTSFQVPAGRLTNRAEVSATEALSQLREERTE